MQAIMLAAGIGFRLRGNDDGFPPKALLRFAGRSLLHRHVTLLRQLPIHRLVMVVGYQSTSIVHEIQGIGAESFVSFVENPRFRRGSVLSLWSARDTLRGGDDVLFMDADVLYHPALIQRLLASSYQDCFLLDRDFEAGDEPVKLCLRDAIVVEFGKQIGDVSFDTIGEWPGFLRLSAATAAQLADVLDCFVAQERLDEPYEEAVREVLLQQAPSTFGIEDITGLPWIEIDFPEDLQRARDHVLPEIERRLAADHAPPVPANAE